MFKKSEQRRKELRIIRQKEKERRIDAAKRAAETRAERLEEKRKIQLRKDEEKRLKEEIKKLGKFKKKR